jgi:hypothetical protein
MNTNKVQGIGEGKNKSKGGGAKMKSKGKKKRRETMPFSFCFFPATSLLLPAFDPRFSGPSRANRRRDRS